VSSKIIGINPPHPPVELEVVDAEEVAVIIVFGNSLLAVMRHLGSVAS
jgi:hypothetical protein